MSRYAPFDMLREGGDQLPDLMAELEQDRIAEGRLNQEAVLDQPGFTSQGPQDAMAMRRSGMFQQPDGTFIDPYRLVAQETRGRINLAQKRNEEQKQAIADSMLFKVGDTLADTGRTFLSPLFWLKGEDTTKYDPSARLKTGYRNQFESLEQLRSENVTKFLNSRNQRLAAAATLSNNQRSQQIQTMSPEQKAIYAFAQSSPERMALYAETDPLKQQAAYDQLLQQYMLKQQGKGLQIKDSQGQQFYLSDNQVSAVDRYSKAFVDQTQTLREGFGNIQQLLATPEEDGTGITDVAAIFSFIKGIDPGSVVRDSEVQLFQQTIGLIEKIRLGAKNTAEGRVLSAAQIKELKKYALRLGEMMSLKFNNRKQIARQQLSSLGLTSEELQNNYLGGYTAPNLVDQVSGKQLPTDPEVVPIDPNNPQPYDEFNPSTNSEDKKDG